jgi:inorganic triphosphatase YgiF
MKRADTPRPAGEIELKLALPAADATGLARRLARVPVLARRKASAQHLHNIYYDTPELALRQQRAALRLRRLGSEARPRWLQTLKTAAEEDSALSRRGEWEVPVPDAALRRRALKETPWPRLDPDGAIFRALAPCFVTSFQRTRWTVRRRNGSVVEVALDIGHIEAGDRRSPICELELELLAGSPQALFDVAQLIARDIAVLPASQSKAERGYALALGVAEAPLRARPPVLETKLSVVEAAQRVLRETFSQFTANLSALRGSDEAEVVHQARVGWRRFRSAWRLFRAALPADAPPPSWLPLQPLLSFLGELRDLDVARTETLPPLAAAYAGGDLQRTEEWQTLAASMLQATTLQRKAVRFALQTPAVGACLLATTQWIENLTDPQATGSTDTGPQEALPRWARQRLDRLRRQLKRALKRSPGPAQQHRVRILAKRLRYAIEALRPFLPKQRAQRWHQQAMELQTTLGATRDLMQASTLAATLEANRGLAEFLRGVAVGTGSSARGPG